MLPVLAVEESPAVEPTPKVPPALSVKFPLDPVIAFAPQFKVPDTEKVFALATATPLCIFTVDPLLTLKLQVAVAVGVQVRFCDPDFAKLRVPPVTAAALVTLTSPLAFNMQLV